MQLPIYLDNAATTPVAPEVLEAMLPFFTESYGNPATLYSVGMSAREGVNYAREMIAEALHATPDEIVFTSGGTESDNAAIKGIVQSYSHKGKHLITSPTEHPAILEPMETLAKQGYELEFLPVDSEGHIDPKELEKRIRRDTLLVSIMHANNEIGTIHNIAEVGAICREKEVFFHTDAVQTFGKLPIDVRKMKIDILSLTAHKFNGPKGAGALYVRRGISLARTQEGGEQEKGRRAGTLNVPGIVGLGRATELAYAEIASESERLQKLRDKLLKELCEQIPYLHINGSKKNRLSHNAHISVERCDGEPILLALDAVGICAAAGSACHTGSVEPSHVLKAIGLSRELSRGAIRITLGRDTTEESIDYAVNHFARIVRELRKLAE